MTELDILLRFPTVVPFGFLSLFMSLLIISIFTVGFDSNVDMPTEIFGVSNPIVTLGVSKVPLAIGLVLTFFPMTIMSVIIDSLLFSDIENFFNNFGIIGNIAYYSIASLSLIFMFYFSLHIAKYLCAPIEKMLNKTKYEVDFIGMNGVVSSSKACQEYGEVKVFIDHFESRLSVYTEEGVEFKINDKVIVFSFNEEKNKYLIIQDNLS